MGRCSVLVAHEPRNTLNPRSLSVSKTHAEQIDAAKQSNWFPMHEMREIGGVDVNQIEIRRIDVLLFDMGGVVVSLHPYRVFEHWSRASGIDTSIFVPKWSIERCYKDYETGKCSFRELASALEVQLGISMELEDWRTGWNALVGKAIPDVFELVNRLADVRPAYCYTNSNPEHESIWGSRLREELQVFKEVFNSSTTGLRKPDVEAYVDVADRMNCPPKNVLFLDDNRLNVEGAKKCGMQAIHVANRKSTVGILNWLVQAIA